jgi:hypothetical protein
MFKLLIAVLLPFFFFSCSSSSDSSDQVEPVAQGELAFSSDSVSGSTNIPSIVSLIKPSASTSLDTISGEDAIRQGLTSTYNILDICQPSETCIIHEVNKNLSKDKAFMRGKFTVTTEEGEEIQCILLYEDSQQRKCLLKEQERILTMGASFLPRVEIKKQVSPFCPVCITPASVFEEEGLIIINDKVSQDWRLFAYDLTSFTLEEVDKNNLTFRTLVTDGMTPHSFQYSEHSIPLVGIVQKSFIAKDSASFLILSNKSRLIFSLEYGKKGFGKETLIEGSSVIDQDGVFYYSSKVTLNQTSSEVFYEGRHHFSSGLHRQGIVKYPNVLVVVGEKEGAHKTREVVFMPQPKKEGVRKLGYLAKTNTGNVDKKKHYIRELCPIQKSGTGENVCIEGISWEMTEGYRNFFLVYGEKTGVKALILLNGDNVEKGAEGEDKLEDVIVVNDLDSTGTDNLISSFNLDSVTSISNYANGFKVTGLKDGAIVIKWYNPTTQSFEDESSLTEDEKKPTTIVKTL